MNTRARIGFVDFIITFATLVSFAAVSPWVWDLIGKLRDQVDPLTSVLIGLLLPMVIIGIILSAGVSARS